MLYRRVLMLANPQMGAISPSCRARRALERAGHAVFWFQPSLLPELFSDGCVDIRPLRALIELWEIDVVVVSDGIGIDASEYKGVTPGIAVLALDEETIESSLSRMRGVETMLLWAPAALCQSFDGRFAAVCEVTPTPRLNDIRIANDIAFSHGAVCFDDATDQRVRVMRLVERAGIDEFGPEFAVRTLGAGWPEEWNSNLDGNTSAFSLAASDMLVSFGDAGLRSELSSFMMSSFCQLSAGKVFNISNDAVESLSSDSCATWEDLSNEFACDYSFHSDVSFEETITAALDETCECSACAGPGCSMPARLAVVLGYVGCGNFGDEYILATIATRLALRVPGTICVAVSENPWHTLINRGIYAIHIRQTHALDELLRRASAALVMAGLLFDQGIRWTMGKAEVVSRVGHSDIPGIAAFSELAYLNSVPLVFYGIGAGPLDLQEGKSLVKMIGALGGQFLCRDERTVEMVRACDVPENQVLRRADVAFTGTSARTSFVDDWLLEQGVDGGADRVLGVSLRDYENVGVGFCANVGAACRAVLERYEDLHVVLCLLDGNDRGISERVMKEIGLQSRVHLFDASDDIDAMADMLCRAAAGLSMRYHASLLLLREGAPCVGLGYLPKVEALYEEAGIAKYLLNMDASTDDITRCLVCALEISGDSLAAINRKVDRLKRYAALEEDELVQMVAASSDLAARTGETEELYLHKESEAERELRAARNEVVREHSIAEGLARELDETKRRVAELEQSNSYRVGSLLMYLPGRIKHAFGRR